MAKGTKGYGRATRNQATAVPRGAGGGGAAAGAAAPEAAPEGSAVAEAPVSANASATAAAPAQASAVASAQGTVPALGRVERDGAVYYDERETWKEEFQSRKGETVALRDGSGIEVGARYSDDGYYVSEGKQRNHATGAYYMSAGLDGIEFVEEDPNAPGRVFVTDRRGDVASYDHTAGLAADASGEKEKTAAQMGAVMAGTRRALRGDPSSLAGQYRDAYDAYMADRNERNNVRATDAYYAWAKSEGGEIGYSHDGAAAEVEAFRARKEDEERARREAAAEAEREAARARTAAQKAAPGLPEEHKKLLAISGLGRVTDAESSFSAEDRAHVPEPDATYVISKSHEEVLGDMGISRSLGVKSFAVLGEPGTGKNFMLEQTSAAEGRPHLEIDVDETTEVSELFGAGSLKDGNMVWREGKVTHALKNGHRVVLNEANTAPVEVMTQFHNVVGSGNSAGSRFITITSPEGEKTRIPVHPDSEIFFTYNPEGTGREGGLGRALRDRVQHFHLKKGGSAEQAAVVAKQANRMLQSAGKKPVDAAFAEKCVGFMGDLRAAHRDNQPGIVDEPDSRQEHRWAAIRAAGGREAGLRTVEHLLDHTSAGSGEAEQFRQSMRDMERRWFGNADRVV